MYLSLPMDSMHQQFVKGVNIADTGAIPKICLELDTSNTEENMMVFRVKSSKSVSWEAFESINNVVTYSQLSIAVSLPFLLPNGNLTDTPDKIVKGLNTFLLIESLKNRRGALKSISNLEGLQRGMINFSKRNRFAPKK